ncbi:MAG: dipeptide epimerase [Calditrichaceae bacterium]|nr:dipeptide epimerase [Calditrichaceae bacterium]MBN2710751.1 dipeptide epimerase [Calditrichaceae bacterium]RQV95702.1 MAG: dipeptide epimerase [Calditrichota bacterium]
MALSNIKETPEVTAKIIRLTLKHKWTLSRNTSAFKENVLIYLRYKGITGYGEAAPNVRYGEEAHSTISKIESVAPLYAEMDIFKQEAIEKRIKHEISDNSCARAALDIALMDWLAKAQNIPLYKLFGCQNKQIVPTSFSIGIDQPDIIKKKVEEAADFQILKVKLGGSNDRQIIEAIRAVTDKPIRVDANEGWKDKHKALDIIRWLKSEGVELIEQPMPAEMLKEITWLHERTDVPLIADESVKSCGEIPQIQDAFDGINIKLMKAGGIQEALRMVAMAKKLNMKIMLGCMIETSVAISAALHLASQADYIDLDGHLLIQEDPFSGIDIVNGVLQIPDKPGLGIYPASV